MYLNYAGEILFKISCEDVNLMSIYPAVPYDVLRKIIGALSIIDWEIAEAKTTIITLKKARQ